MLVESGKKLQILPVVVVMIAAAHVRMLHITFKLLHMCHFYNLLVHFLYVQPWTLQPRVGVFATNAAVLWQQGTKLGGVVLAPGVYTRPLVLGSIRHFDLYGIKVQASPQLFGAGECIGLHLVYTGEHALVQRSSFGRNLACTQ